MTSRMEAIVSKQRAFDPAQVCTVKVHPALVRLFYYLGEETWLIETMAIAIDANLDAALVIEAVEARYTALAAWTLGSRVDERPDGEFRLAVILDAIAVTPLQFDGRHYHFDPKEFRKALRKRSLN